MTPHGLRHTHTALLLENEETVPGIQLRVGHASIKATLNVYAHISKEINKQIKSIMQVNDFAAHILYLVGKEWAAIQFSGNIFVKTLLQQ
ncbi:tyrosine-type recombinase/integrase [Peribacillus sp. YIM B13482]|uniref:tyrosine-type recombinase/integrase n=1 Tax=Peribacillus sp. YIM B13482 TaxID=3366298 RepID=UPI00366AC028